MKFVRILLGISLILPVFSTAPVMAAANKTTEKEESKVTTVAADETVKTTAATDKTTSTEPSTDSTARTTRLESLKTTLKVKLDEVTKKRIIAKCKAAQTIVEATEKTDKSNGVSRESAYKKITDSLQKLIDRLKTDGVDTKELEAAQATLLTKIDQFTTDLATYRQSMTDLRSLDCITDPTAFQAALTSARADRLKAKTDAVDIRSYLTNTIKPLLVTLKTAVKGSN